MVKWSNGLWFLIDENIFGYKSNITSINSFSSLIRISSMQLMRFEKARSTLSALVRRSLAAFISMASNVDRKRI